MLEVPCILLARVEKVEGGVNQQEMIIMIKHTDLAWLAGIIDGEGSIMFFRKAKYEKSKEKRYGWIATGISVTNCDELMIKRISQILWELGISFHFCLQHCGKIEKGWNVALKIETNGLNQCKKLLTEVLPYLVNKSYLAKFMIQYIDWRQSKGFNNNRLKIEPEELQKWFDQYETIRHPKSISSETARKASVPLGMDDDTVRALRRRKELNLKDSD